MERIPVIARVEARCGGWGEEKPVAVRMGGHRRSIAEILEERLVGPPEAGRPVHRVVRVLLEDGDELLLERRVPEGEWRVHRAVIPGSDRLSGGGHGREE